MGVPIAACGLVCAECEAYLATQANDAEEIAKVAAKWEQQFGSTIPPQTVWCDGCMVESDRKCGHCADCDVRACVTSKSLMNCAECPDYGCETITKFFEMVPCCKGRLDAIRGAA